MVKQGLGIAINCFARKVRYRRHPGHVQSPCPAFYGVTLVKSQLYEIATVSGGALAVAVGTLLAAACVAGLIPARRAASVDPAQALRTE